METARGALADDYMRAYPSEPGKKVKKHLSYLADPITDYV